MDHHCPWISNCVGFYNRKFFMLMLIYALMSLLVVIIGCPLTASTYFIKRKHKLDNFGKEYIPLTSLAIAYILVLVLFFALINFFKFHLTMVLTNSTTIENLDTKRHPGELSGNVNSK